MKKKAADLKFGRLGIDMPADKKQEKIAVSKKLSVYAVAVNKQKDVENIKKELAKAGYTTNRNWTSSEKDWGALNKGYVDIYDDKGNNVGAFHVKSRVVGNDKWEDLRMGGFYTDNPKLGKTLQNMGLNKSEKTSNVIQSKNSSIADALKAKRASWEKKEREKPGGYNKAVSPTIKEEKILGIVVSRTKLLGGTR